MSEDVARNLEQNEEPPQVLEQETVMEAEDRASLEEPILEVQASDDGPEDADEDDGEGDSED